VTGTRGRRAGGARRAAVLDAVADVLAARGYESTRFADVSAASGVAISTLQNYFGSRADMVIEAMEVFTDREVDALEALAAAEPDPWRRLVALVDRSLHNEERTWRILVEFWRSAMRDEALRDYSTRVWTRYRAPFVAAVGEVAVREAAVQAAAAPDVAVLEATVREGDRRPDHEAATDLLLLSLAGLIVARVQQTPAPDPDAFRDLMLTQLQQMLGSPNESRMG
jgi:AcrR family transcriptional regulator